VGSGGITLVQVVFTPEAPESLQERKILEITS